MPDIKITDTADQPTQVAPAVQALEIAGNALPGVLGGLQVLQGVRQLMEAKRMRAKAENNKQAREMDIALKQSVLDNDYLVLPEFQEGGTIADIYNYINAKQQSDNAQYQNLAQLEIQKEALNAQALAAAKETRKQGFASIVKGATAGIDAAMKVLPLLEKGGEASDKNSIWSPDFDAEVFLEIDREVQQLEEQAALDEAIASFDLQYADLDVELDAATAGSGNLDYVAPVQPSNPGEVISPVSAGDYTGRTEMPDPSAGTEIERKYGRRDPGVTLGDYNNNPLNLKYRPWQDQYGAEKSLGATDGGEFAHFPTPQAGLDAAKSLLRGKTYRNLAVPDAQKLWSNNGYTNLYPEMDDRTVGELSDAQLQELVRRMAKREDPNLYAKTTSIHGTSN